MNESKIVDERIISFIDSNTNLTLAVSENNKPYCANCFYAFDKENLFLVFKSKLSTNNIEIALKNSSVAGTIVPDSLDKLHVKGIQFTGKVKQADGENLSAAKKIYYLKYPFAMALPGELWIIELHTLKYTDNTLGFGKRLEWVKEGEQPVCSR